MSIGGTIIGFMQSQLPNTNGYSTHRLEKHFIKIVQKSVAFSYDYLKDNMTKKDLLILLSYKGESAEGVNLLIDSQIRGITRVVFTCTSRNTMAQLSDYCLYVPTESIKTPTRLTYEVSTTFYFIIEQLFLEYVDELERSQKGDTKRNSS